ncbi:DinB family protein [Deinococcus planocerae]|uniref:DinB family protein n=1 Tax=Deinococcus planocerae TaxID=1737569 RepID=UPI000C7F04BB|nr:DinB family protein [Deinococcus planocerae]
MNELKQFLIEQYGAELGAFRAALESIPAEGFGTATVGHSPAWHALHVAEWLRLAVLNDRSPSYAHLGWEDREWVGTLSGEPAHRESAGKAVILAHLDEVTERVLSFIHNLNAADLQAPSFSPSAPGGQRPRLQGIGMHLRHVAYHRGQIQLGKKERA